MRKMDGKRTRKDEKKESEKDKEIDICNRMA